MSTRATFRPLLAAGLVAGGLIAGAALAACEPKAVAVVDAGPPKPAPGLSTTTRPPHPNMATASWGERVLRERVAALPATAPAPASARAAIDAAVAHLGSLEPGAEQSAVDSALAGYRASTTDLDRGTAVAVLAAALAVDPHTGDYKERLTDAYGLAAYAGTLDQVDATGQAARALTGALAGSVKQSESLLESLVDQKLATVEPRWFLALARRVLGARVDDNLVADLEAVLAAHPEWARTRLALAELFLEAGLYADVRRVVDGSPTPHPRLLAVSGLAQSLQGDAAAGAALLRKQESAIDEAVRGDALFALARALLLEAAANPERRDALLAEVEPVMQSLAQRPGYGAEAALVRGQLAFARGDYVAARGVVDTTRAPPTELQDDLLWLLVDACAGAGDTACVERFVPTALERDGDVARAHAARAALVLVGGGGQAHATDGGVATPAILVDDELREQHRAQPFDPRLAEKVGEPVARGGVSGAAQLLRAARKAAAQDAPQLLVRALAPLQADKALWSSCRACRSLDVETVTGALKAPKARAALEGGGADLALADLVRVIGGLGASPDAQSIKALDAFAGDTRPAVENAVAAARADHKDPQGRRLRESAGKEGPGHAGHGHGDDGPALPEAPIPPQAPPAPGAQP